MAWHDGGRIVVGWRSELVQLDILECSSKLIHLSVCLRVAKNFRCTFVYGSTCKQDRLRLFHHLGVLRKDISLPWIVLGDFNSLAHLNERIGAPVRLHEVTPLNGSVWQSVVFMIFIILVGFIRGIISKLVVDE